jgi:hypothetical protein
VHVCSLALAPPKLRTPSVNAQASPLQMYHYLDFVTPSIRSSSTKPTVQHNYNNATLLDDRLPLRRLQRHARRIRRTRPQEAHRGPSSHRQLGNSRKLSSKPLFFLSTHYPPRLTCTAHSLGSSDLRLGRRTPEHRRHGPAHRRHDYVLRQLVSARPRPAAIWKVCRSCDAAWWTVFDWRVGCAGGYEEAGCAKI